jgi:hypothetical protein
MSQPDADTETERRGNSPPDGLVWRHTDSDVYHTTNCQMITADEQIRTIRREIAESWSSWHLCYHCSDESSSSRHLTGNNCEECGTFKSALRPDEGEYLCDICYDGPSKSDRDISWELEN